MKNILNLFLAFCMACTAFACDSNSDVTPENDSKEEKDYDMSGFARGADVSWLTEMEHDGVQFYTLDGEPAECMWLLRELGMNAIRLRVWVNPEGGWNNKADVLKKALRADALGFRLMIDFHYSDWWADPGKQTKPAAWQSLSMDALKEAVAAHTVDVLSELKANNITPEWVQVGNETGNGMLWDEGKAESNMAGYAELNNAGYDAVKSVFPNTQVIVHVHNGYDKNLFAWLFDGLRNNGGKWDVIGMSLYPEPSDWETLTQSCLENVKGLISRYNTPVIICEVGMSRNQAAVCKSFLTRLITESKAIDRCQGVLYWEPQGFGKCSYYAKSDFSSRGPPTASAYACFRCAALERL